MDKPLTLSFAKPAYAAEPFTITSPTFADNGQLVLKNGGAMKVNPDYRGENVSPPLAWSNIHEGTKSFVLVIWDPKGRSWIRKTLNAGKFKLPKGGELWLTP